MKKKKRRGLLWMVSALLGFACALVLGALFYGAMVYQLSGEEGSGAAVRPGTLLAIEASLVKEETQEIEVAAQACRAVVRTYALENGETAQAVSASPAAYFELLALEGFSPRLVTGFTLAGLDAVYYTAGERMLLAARSGEMVYLLQAQADEQTLYALGASAILEEHAQ